jgi:hypothetical protein
MVTAAWRDFATEIARWSEIGRPVEFWWRDDDACRPNAALSRLFDLASSADVPLALAAVPEPAEPEAFKDLPARVMVIQHGTDHRNRAAAGEKKTEFSAFEPPDDAIRRLLAARDILESRVEGRLLRVLAPPWNRVSPLVIPRLWAAGYSGLSTFGVRKITNSSDGLVQVNTHIDIIDWKGNRGFCGEESLLGQAIRHLAARRKGEVDPTEPTGWLTHHAVHDDACWYFLAKLFDSTKAMHGVIWHSPSTLFPSMSIR